jgi:hypothetical protein
MESASSGAATHESTPIGMAAAAQMAMIAPSRSCLTAPSSAGLAERSA